MKIHKRNPCCVEIKAGKRGPICNLFKGKKTVDLGWFPANSAIASIGIFSDTIHKWDGKNIIARIGNEV